MPNQPYNPPSLIEDFVKGIWIVGLDLAIRRNRDQLRQIVLALFALAGGLTSPAGGRCPALPGERGLSPVTSPFHHRLIMAVLRPAESAVRRLIVIAAYGLKLNGPAKPAAALTSPLRGEVPGFAGRRGVYRAFPLFDPLKSFDPDTIWDSEPAYQSDYGFTKSIAWHDASTDSTPVEATHFGHRLNAVLRPLNDLPRQARRLKRWELKRDAALKASKPTRLSPMRPGLPPGWRRDEFTKSTMC